MTSKTKTSKKTTKTEPVKRKEITAKYGNEDISIVVRNPNSRDRDLAEVERRKFVAAAIKGSDKNPVLMRNQVESFLRENNIWTATDEQRQRDIANEISLAFAKLNKGGISVSEGRKLAILITQKRNESIELLAKRRAFDETTLEAGSEDAFVDYLVYLCTMRPSGERFWDSLEAMVGDSDTELYLEAHAALQSFIYGIEDNYIDTLPEIQWLKKFGFIDDEYRYVDRKTGKRVNVSGDPIDVEGDEDEEMQEVRISGDDVVEPVFFEDDGSPIAA
jgi:hypothetical protein